MQAPAGINLQLRARVREAEQGAKARINRVFTAGKPADFFRHSVDRVVEISGRIAGKQPCQLQPETHRTIP